jgi:hypothetical protein
MFKKDTTMKKTYRKPMMGNLKMATRCALLGLSKTTNEYNSSDVTYSRENNSDDNDWE